MKAALFDVTGNKKGEVLLPKVFETPVREDVVAKAVEFERRENTQPHALSPTAGRRHSASGTISHKRHEWKGHYGKGISRVPRKTMNRHGTQFYWVGAEVANTRGGRRVHGPTLWKAYKKVNDKEMKLALASAIAATANESMIVKRYDSVDKAHSTLPVLESLPSKSKELMSVLSKALSVTSVLERKTSVRAGKGKNRGRPTKTSAGVLVVVGNKEKNTYKDGTVKSVKDLSVLDLYPLGRVAVYTKAALEDLKNV